MKRGFLMLMVFLCGAAGMGIEMGASRLLRPFFGDSILVWANIIGLILTYLSLGYLIGGRWADRDPRPSTLYRAIFAAGLTVGLLPLVAKPFLDLAIPALQRFDAGLGLTSFAGTLALFFVPVTLLGCVSPFAIRICSKDISSKRRHSRQLVCLSTIGSIIGVFGTVFFLFDLLGTEGHSLPFQRCSQPVSLVGLALEGSIPSAVRHGALYGILAIVGMVFAATWSSQPRD